MYKISVIIPIYNSSIYLRTCLNSLVNQTLDNIEIIAIDDNSCDNSWKILLEYEEKYRNIKIYHNERNLGQGRCRNIGIKIANGRYIGFVDSDDLIDDETYAKVLYTFEKYKDLDCYIYQMKAFDDDDSFQSSKDINKWLVLPETGLTRMNFDLARKTNIHVCNKVFKRDYIDYNGIEFPEGLLYEDIYFMWQYYRQDPLVYFDDSKTYHYRLRSNSIMSDTNKSRDFNRVIHHLKNIEKLIDDIAKVNTMPRTIEYLQKLISIYEGRTKRAGLEQDYKKIEEYTQYLKDKLENYRRK